ncbi:MAG: hypothetical protein CMF39_06095 [Legionellaceae bacterium]|nr:hypothetical protein [Legionellaceae bacterium]
MVKKLSSVSAIVFTGLVTLSQAAPVPTNQQLQKEIKQLQTYLSTQTKQTNNAAKLEEYSGIGTRGYLNDRIVFSGGVISQLQLSNYDDSSSFTGGPGRDLRLSTAYLNVHGIVTKNLSAFATISVEPGQVNVYNGTGGMQFEEAYFNYFSRHGTHRFNAQLGQAYLPFGIYKIHPVVATLTQSLDETNRPMASLNYAQRPFFVSGYVFSSALDTTLDSSSGAAANKLNAGVRVGMGDIQPGWAYDFEVDYINNMAQAREIAFLLPTTYRRVPNLAVHAMLDLGGLGFDYNLSTPIHNFDRRDMKFNGENAAPKAQSFGLNYLFSTMGKHSSVSASFEMSYEALALNLPESRIVLSYQVDLNQYLGLTFEALRSVDYSTSTSYQLRQRGTTNLTSLAYGTGRANITGVAEVDIHF